VLRGGGCLGPPGGFGIGVGKKYSAHPFKSKIVMRCFTLALFLGSTTAFVSSPANHAPARQYFGAVRRSGGTGPSMVPRRRHSLATLPTMMAVSVPAVLPDDWVVCGALCVHVDALHRTAVCAVQRTCALCGPVPDTAVCWAGAQAGKAPLNSETVSIGVGGVSLTALLINRCAPAYRPAQAVHADTDVVPPDTH